MVSALGSSQSTAEHAVGITALDMSAALAMQRQCDDLARQLWCPALPELAHVRRLAAATGECDKMAMDRALTYISSGSAKPK